MQNSYLLTNISGVHYIDNMKNIKAYAGIVILLLIVSVSALVIFKNNNKLPNRTEKIIVEEPSTTKVSDIDLKDELDATLEVLLSIHYISLRDIETTDANRVILDELQESMNDVNKLKNLSYKVETLSKSKNEIIATTGLVLQATTLRLTSAYNLWIEYLRGIDLENFSATEFQYQLALFTTSTHDVYMSLLEGAYLLPMITVEFAKEESQNNLVNEDLKNHFLIKMDSLFKDVLAQNDIFYKETKNRYAVAILINNYKDFFTSSNETQ